MILALLFACTNEKIQDSGNIDDTAVEDTGTEDLDTAIEDTGAEDPDTGDAEQEEASNPAHELYPELLEEYEQIRSTAYPFPLGIEDPGNFTAVQAYALSMLPIIQLQMSMDIAEQSGTPMTCPMVEGTFPDEGLPNEDIIVTGGCTAEDGTIYAGSFIYNQSGANYTNYTVMSSSEECPDVTETSVFNGGFSLDMTTYSVGTLFKMDRSESNMM